MPDPVITGILVVPAEAASESSLVIPVDVLVAPADAPDDEAASESSLVIPVASLISSTVFSLASSAALRFSSAVSLKWP